MKEISIIPLGYDQFEVISKSKGKENKHISDLRNHICSCKGWFYSKKPKSCVHIKSIIQILRAGGHYVKWNRKEEGHYDLGLIKCQQQN